jgi:hypothetical protein
VPRTPVRRRCSTPDLTDSFRASLRHRFSHNTFAELGKRADRFQPEPRLGDYMRHAKGYEPPDLSWSRETWLHRPTREVVLNSNPRVPQTIDAAKKQRKTWLLIGSQANIEGGYYRRDMDMGTATAEQPTYTAT